MGHSQAEKAKTHEKVLKLAAAQIREHGIDALGVAELMKDAGLTHGGFYVHFPSRDVLIAEALERALQSGPLANLGAGKSPSAFVRGYLSPEHRDGPASGCAISALSGEIRNSTPKTREILTKHLKERFQIMINRINRRDEIAGSDIERLFNCAVDARIPNDYFSLHRAVTLGQPVEGHCELGKAIENLARRLSGIGARDGKRAAMPDLNAVASVV